ncbi:CD209 antigen-like protein E isoform X2 [Chelmon rostratus]|uniref:CD209 antigen-like protein E isoform X2 n=1 Tax=Chelmon rostratus TaxID=109905 RepID=UPI001BEA3B80|nr:CD209 antigen-like protein E isoform X2 [Chelmon rostratus]
MSVFFHSSGSDINIEVELRHLSAVVLSFGLLCVLQGILNISLRLALNEPTDGGETEEESCPQGWMMFGSSCYYISSQRRSWDDSRQDCVQRDADLVIIDSREEQAFLTGFTMATWVGMTDREEEGTWVWVDGTPVNKDGLQWALGQPDSAFGGEDCGDLRTMIDFIGLNDFNCSARNQWICEKTLWPLTSWCFPRV